MAATPEVSVLVTTFCHAPFVRTALESLRCQSFENFEVIITDDASPDGTADVVETWLQESGFPAIFVRNAENRGICANRNAGLAQARGRFVCSLSGDDAYAPDRLARQVAEFARLPADVAAIYGDAWLIDADGHRLESSFLERRLGDHAPPADVFSALLEGPNFIPAPTVMIRRSAIDAVGGYDETLFFEDLDMWLRLSRQFRFHYLPGCVMDYRVLADSMSRGDEYRPRMVRAEFQVVIGWLATVPDRQVAIGRRLRALIARMILAEDMAGARLMADELASSVPGTRHRMLAGILAVPGAPAGVRLALRLAFRADAVMARLRAAASLDRPG